MLPFSEEERALLKLFRPFATGESPKEQISTELQELAIRRGLAPALAGLLAERLTPIEALERECHRNSRQVLYHCGWLKRIVRALSQEGIRVLSLKGPALSQMLWQRADLRVSNDLDIWVDLQDVSKCLSILACLDIISVDALALTPSKLALDYQLCCSNKDHSFLLELHWGLCQRAYSFRLPFAKAWKERQAVSLHGDDVFCLNSVHNLVYLCMHACRHRWDHPAMIVDISQQVELLSDAQLQSALQLSKSLGCLRQFLLTMKILQQLFAADFPEFLLKALQQHLEHLEHLGTTLAKLKTNSSYSLIYDRMIHDSIIDRWRWLLTPRREDIQDGRVWRAYPRRWLRLLRKFSGPVKDD